VRVSSIHTDGSEWYTHRSVSEGFEIIRRCGESAIETGPVAGPKSEPVAGSVAEPGSEPVAEPVAGPVAGLVAGPVAKPGPVQERPNNETK